MMRQRAVMVEQFNSYSRDIPKKRNHDSAIELNKVSTLTSFPDKLESGTVELSLVETELGRIILDLEALNCFEVVERQFEHQGVIFSNAIALAPSNPAFPSKSGRIVIMGAPKSGAIEVSFLQPVHLVNSLVTSSRRTVLCAYNEQGEQIAEVETLGPNLAGSPSLIPPNAELIVNVPNIHRVTFYAFDGHLTLAGFGFAF
ncbi:hypothetical protein [Laspinema olomoucense]|uniref:hypothetical protein n=1 Tax=Laspinema olomoucense TaxID=3231600 RepID=UPI0021BA76F4|nr:MULTISPECIES: hypothetical protein [unclassified Laspinema]MCT7975077.1 hypothetical protein [Laspinema sp. D3d]MCT7987135.1 hypothetical protein [Laspinema sp. D3a]